MDVGVVVGDVVVLAEVVGDVVLEVPLMAVVLEVVPVDDVTDVSFKVVVPAGELVVLLEGGVPLIPKTPVANNTTPTMITIPNPIAIIL
jgi:hypothetical protein